MIIVHRKTTWAGANGFRMQIMNQRTHINPEPRVAVSPEPDHNQRASRHTPYLRTMWPLKGTTASQPSFGLVARVRSDLSLSLSRFRLPSKCRVHLLPSGWALIVDSVARLLYYRFEGLPRRTRLVCGVVSQVPRGYCGLFPPGASRRCFRAGRQNRTEQRDVSVCVGVCLGRREIAATVDWNLILLGRMIRSDGAVTVVIAVGTGNGPFPNRVSITDRGQVIRARDSHRAREARSD